MFDTIKTAICKALFTKDVCAWIIKTALNAALKKSKDPAKREKVCEVLVGAGTLMKVGALACADGEITDAESVELEAQSVEVGEAIYALIKG